MKWLSRLNSHRSGPTISFHWRTSAAVWMRGSLRRWLMLPLLVQILALALGGMLLGFHVTRVLLTRVYNQSLLASSTVAATMVEERVQELSLLTSQSARLGTLAHTLRAGKPISVTAEIASTAHLRGLEAAAVADASGRVEMAVGNHIGSLVSHRMNTPTTFNADVQRTVQHILASGLRGPDTELGVTGSDGEPLLYAVSKVIGDGGVQGVLVMGTPLRGVLQSVTDTFGNFLVFYDPTGTPVLSTFSPVVSGAANFPHLSNAEVTAGNAQPDVLEATLLAESYHYVERPLAVNGVRLGYLGVWQPAKVVTQNVKRWYTILLGAICLASALVLSLGLWLAERITRLVLAITESTKKLTDGNFVHVTPEMAVGELSQLADALNRMAERVQSQTHVLQERARRSSYLFQASAELGRTLDLDEAVQIAAEVIYGLGGLSYVVVMVGDGELGPYTCRAVRGLSPKVAARILGQEYQVPLWGVMAHALVSRQPLVIDDVAAQGRPQAGEFDWNVGSSMLFFPVCGAHEPSGLIIAGASEPGQFNADNLGDTVIALARIAAHSILNTQLYQEAAWSQEHLVTLQMISKVVASAADVEEVLDVIVREAGEMTGGNPAWVFLKDVVAGTDRLYSRPRLTPSDFWTGVHQSAVSWVMQAGQPIFYDPRRTLDQSPILASSGPAMCVPLEVNDETIGALIVTNDHQRRLFVENDMIVLRTLANSAAAALQTAQLTQRALRNRQAMD